MPHGVVKTKADEKKWQLAMKIVKDQYHKTDKDDDFYAIVMGVWKNMKKGDKGGKKKSAADVLRKIASDLLNS